MTSAVGWVEPLRNSSSGPREFDGFVSLYPFYALALMALSFLMPATLFIWSPPDMTRKELTDFVGEQVGVDEYTFCV